MGGPFPRLGGPAVIGEIMPGILLATPCSGIPLGNGETLTETMLPDAFRPALSGLANLGLILFNPSSARN